MQPRLISDEEQLATLEEAIAGGALIWEVYFNGEGGAVVTFKDNGEKHEWRCGMVAGRRAKELLLSA